MDMMLLLTVLMAGGHWIPAKQEEFVTFCHVWLNVLTDSDIIFPLHPIIIHRAFIIAHTSASLWQTEHPLAEALRAQRAAISMDMARTASARGCSVCPPLTFNKN
jgi:hypothetical protein